VVCSVHLGARRSLSAAAAYKGGGANRDTDPHRVSKLTWIRLDNRVARSRDESWYSDAPPAHTRLRLSAILDVGTMEKFSAYRVSRMSRSLIFMLKTCKDPGTGIQVLMG
jgi:hypothetical protein